MKEMPGDFLSQAGVETVSGIILLTLRVIRLASSKRELQYEC